MPDYEDFDTEDDMFRREDPIRAKLDVVDDCDLRDALQAVLDLCDAEERDDWVTLYIPNVRTAIAEKLGVEWPA